MVKRGRHSMEELILKDGGLAAALERPDAPYDLDEEAVEEWRRIVNSMPADHFIPANHHVLILLCQHIIESRRQGHLIASYCKRKERADVRVYLDLCKQKALEDQLIIKLSRSMRLTHQSTFSQKAVKLSRIAQQQIDLNVNISDDEAAW